MAWAYPSRRIDNLKTTNCSSSTVKPMILEHFAEPDGNNVS